ncbi:AI-2E family transporter [Comamonas aquatica]|uniref:AI-2E family transporter n=1 Tax=Comamonas aquatica TaxID=225991 RepID=UPI003CFEAA01
MSDPSPQPSPSTPTEPQTAQGPGSGPASARPTAYRASQGNALVAIVPGLRWMVGLMIAAIVIVGLYFGREILIPLALAVLLGFLLDPAVTRLHRWGLPRLAAALLVVALALGALAGLGLYLGKQVQALSADLPTYQTTIKQKLRNLRVLTAGPSAWDGAVKTYGTVEREIAAATAEPGQRPSRVQQVEVVRDEDKPVLRVAQWLGKVSEPLTQAGIVLLFVILILLDRDDLRDRLLRLMGGNPHVATDAMDEAAHRIGRYLRMQCIVNVAYGVPMAAGLWLIGVPGAILWGVLAAVLRFVPYVGPLVAAVFPLALAFAVAPGWDMLMWTLALVLVLELVSNHIVEPWLYGSSTGLSTLAIIIAATFWTALWGPIGLILSTPLTACCLVLGRYLPGLQFLEVLLGSQPVMDAPHRLYQRLLAEDVSDAIALARSDIAQRLPARPAAADKAAAVEGFYGQVALPALQLACKHHAEAATVEHRMRLSNGMEDLLEELTEDYPGAPGLADAAACGRVHCVGARWAVDAWAARMLAHSLQLQGLPATSASHALAPDRGLDGIGDWQEVQWLVLSTLHGQPHILLRQWLRRIRRRYPQLQVVLALWNVSPEGLQGEDLQRLGVQALVTSLHEAVLRIQQAASPVPTTAQGCVPARRPPHEAQRLQHLQHSGALDAGCTEVYRNAALKAAHAFDVKYAQVSLVDADWVHTPGGLLVHGGVPPASPGLPRDASICAYVVQEGQSVVVDSLARDPRFADNPWLRRAGIQFYAGVPLVDAAGMVLGSLSILHDAPRSMDASGLAVLQAMAREVMQQVQARAQGATGAPPAA